MKTACVAILLFAAGCVSESTRTTANGEKIVTTPAGPHAVDQAIAADPSATRLHEVAGAMLLYYAVNKQMPAKLDDLKPFADTDAPLELTSPTSGEPFTYVPDGLYTPGHDQGIVVYDPAVAKGSQRWCIFMSPGPRGAAKSLDVLPVPEPIFLTYTPRAAR